MAEEQEAKKEITLDGAKRYRLFCRLGFALVAWIIPLAITLAKFDLFRQNAAVKIGFLGLLIVLLIGWRMKDKIVEWINSWENSNMFKHILIGFGKVFPFALMVIILGLCKASVAEATKPVDDMLFCLEWTALCELVAYVGIYPFEMKFDYIVNRMIRKNERVCDYKEAIKEMNNHEQN